MLNYGKKPLKKRQFCFAVQPHFKIKTNLGEPRGFSKLPSIKGYYCITWATTTIQQRT